MDKGQSTLLMDFNRFFQTYQRRFIHFAYTYTHDEAAAEDIVMEAMTDYWEQMAAPSHVTNAPAYVLTMVKHKCIDYLRHLQYHQKVSDEITQLYTWELSTRLSTLEEFEPKEIFTKEILEVVEGTLQKLPKRTRQIFLMSRYENLSHKEIADRLEITTKGVEFHIAKATKLLRVALKDYLPTALLYFYIN